MVWALMTQFLIALSGNVTTFCNNYNRVTLYCYV